VGCDLNIECLSSAVLVITIVIDTFLAHGRLYLRYTHEKKVLKVELQGLRPPTSNFERQKRTYAFKSSRCACGTVEIGYRRDIRPDSFLHQHIKLFVTDKNKMSNNDDLFLLSARLLYVDDHDQEEAISVFKA
jgi:hypothetical protein